MKSFAHGFLEKQRIPQNLLRTIRLLGEYKGKEEVFKQQSPQVLDTLRQAAVIQSTESSNRIEGVVAPHDRIVKIVKKEVKPGNRSEQEIAGYRDVLNTIHASHGNMKFSMNLVLLVRRKLQEITMHYQSRKYYRRHAVKLLRHTLCFFAEVASRKAFS